MKDPRTAPAFSLVEVSLAVGIAGVALVVILGLLAAVARRSTDAEDTHTALRLADAVRLELDARARRVGFEALAASLPALSAATDDGLLLVAARDGTALRARAGGETPAREQYFLIEVRRFASGPLVHATGAGSLALNVRVSWPYRAAMPDGLAEPVPFAQRQSIHFNTAVNR